MNMELKDDLVIQNFKDGKIGIFPTDTSFGIGCRIDNQESIEKIFEIRNRPPQKALLALISSIEMAEEYVYVTPEAKIQLFKKYWPGGLTVILKCKKDKVPAIVRASGESLAIRLPDHTDLRRVIEAVGVPIIAPSANFSGGQTPVTLDMVEKDLVKEVDFVVDGRCTMEGVSTIIDTTVLPFKIIRQGVVEVI